MRLNAWVQFKDCFTFFTSTLLFFIPLNSCFEFNLVTPVNGPTSGGVLITAWGNLVSADNWNECNTAGSTFGVEESTLSATFYPSLFFESKVGGVPQKHWLTFSKECSLSAGYSVFTLPELPSGAFAGVLWYSVKKDITSPRGMQDALSLPFSYDFPVILNLSYAQPAAGGGALTIFGNNFRKSSVPLSVSVGSTSCLGISLVHPHSAFKCSTKPFVSGPSKRLNVSVLFDTSVSYSWMGFSFGDVRGIVVPTPLNFPNALTGNTIIHAFTSQSLGMRSTSLFAAIYFSSCSFSAWLSDTSLRCKQPSGLVSPKNSSLRVSLPSAGSYRYQAIVFNQSPSCKFLQLMQARNESFRSSTGSSTIFFTSTSLGDTDNSAKSRIDATFCDSSVWYSDSVVAAKTPLSKKPSTVAVVSISNIVSLCPEIHNISLIPVAGNVSTFHSATSGPFFLFVNCLNLGSINTCSKLRLADSTTSLTVWVSDSQVVSKMSTRAASSQLLPAYLSISNIISKFNLTLVQTSLSSSLKVDGSSDLFLNFPSTGNVYLSLMLSSTGILDSTPRVIRSFSACSASSWKSETNIICKSGADFLATSALTLSIEVCKFDFKTFVTFSPAITNPNTSKHFEEPSSGSGKVALLCRSLGVSSFSRSVKLHHSACQFSSWISETTIICKPHLVSNFFGAIFISSDRLFPSGNATNSRRFHIFGNSTNTPFTGSSMLALFGFGLFSHDPSTCVRLAGSAGDFTSWNSYTNINVKVSRGKGFFGITVSLQTDVHQDNVHISAFDFEDFSFLPFSYVFNVTTHYPSSGGLQINLLGSSASNEDQSGSVRLSATTYLFSKWISWTSLMCKTSQSHVNSASSTFVSYGLVVDVRFANLPLPKLKVVIPGSTTNVPLTGSLMLKMSGSSLQNFDTSIRMQVCGTGPTSTSWFSDSCLIAMTSGGAIRSAFASVTVAQIFSNVFNLSFVPLFTNFSVLSASASVSNAFPPTSGATKILFSGNGMGVTEISSAARFRATSCNVLIWQSESSIVCKMSAGSGASSSLFFSQNLVPFKFSTSSTLRTGFAIPNVKNFSTSIENPSFILVHGSNYAPFNSDVKAVATFNSFDGAVSIEFKQTRILLTSDALLQGKTIRDIQILIQIKASRLDDVVVSLETSPFVGRIFLLKSQCFGCVKSSNDTGLMLIFSDKALNRLPDSDCSSGIYLPTTPFSSLFAFSGLIYLQVTSGASPVTFLSSSITITQSNVNIVADKTYPSFGISWYSDSALKFKIPPPILGTNHSFMAIVDDQNSNTRTGIDYPIPVVVQQSARPLSIPSTGSSVLAIFGSFFGQISSTLRIRMGKSSCLSSIWTSDEICFCKSSPGLSNPDPFGLTATVVRQVSTFKTLIVQIFESPLLVLADVTKGLLSTGNFFVFASGSGFANSHFSPKNRISKSSAASTLWFSDSSLNSLVSTKWKIQLQLTVSLTKLSTHANFSFSLTQNLQSNRLDTSIPRSGSSLLLVLGSGFMPNFVSLQVKISESAASATLWTSDSCLWSQNSRIGLATALGVTVTVPNWQFPATVSDSILVRPPATELYGSFEFQNRSVLYLSSPSWQRYSALNVQGRDFGYFQSKLFNSLSIDPDIGCDTVQFISDTSLSAACQVSPPGSEVVFRMSILQSSFLTIQTFPARFLSSLNVAGIIGNSALSLKLPSTGNVILSISGNDFSSVYGTIARISSTSCSNSIWHSASSMTCRVPSGVGFGLPFVVSSLKKLSQSISEFVDHAYPHVSSLLMQKLPATGAFNSIPFSFGLGNQDFSTRTRLIASSILSQRWHSDSAVSLKISRVMMISEVSIAFSLGQKKATFSNSQVFDAAHLSVNETHGIAFASSGTSFYVISGERLGTFGISPKCRIAVTSCSVSSWSSDSLVQCKIPYGLGIVDYIIFSGSASNSISLQPMKQEIYTESVLQSFNNSGSSILFKGSCFGQVVPTDTTVSQMSNIQVPPNTASVILTSSALMERRAIFSIVVSVSIRQMSRLDDIVIVLEVLQSVNHPRATEIVLFQNQCFGCIFNQGSSIRFDFGDEATAPAPLSKCASLGSFTPKFMRFESIYGFSGIMRLKVLSGSNTVVFESASIIVSRSNLNLVFTRILDNNNTEVAASKSISWTSDSSLSSTFPAVVGNNIAIQGIMYQRNSNILSGFAFPSAQFSTASKSFPSSGASFISLVGLFFGQIDASPRIRIGASSCPVTLWISDVAVMCRRIAAGQHYTRANLQASVAKTVGEAWSLSAYDSEFRTQYQTIQPSTGSIHVDIILHGIGVSDMTSKMRSCFSSSISTLWTSDSALRSLIPFCYRSNPVYASINQQVATIPFDFVQKLLMSQFNSKSEFLRTASNLVAISGSGFGWNGASATARISISSCPASIWISDSSLFCRIPQSFLNGAKDLSISAAQRSAQSGVIKDIYGNVSPLESSKIELLPFYPVNTSISLLEQLKIFSTGTNYGFATSMKVGSTPCRELLWSSQSSIACSIHCPIPYTEPFLIFGLKNSGDEMSAITSNSRYLPVKYSLASSIITSISAPPVLNFGPPSWSVTSFTTFQKFDMSFQFFNNNSEPYMHFSTDENGIIIYSRVPIFIIIQIQIQQFDSQTGQILCENAQLLNSVIPAGERNAVVSSSVGFCASSEKVRFAFTICLTSDEEQKLLFSAGQSKDIPMSNTTQVFYQSPWLSVLSFAPFFAVEPISSVPSVITAGVFQYLIPAFEVKTKTSCSNTYVNLSISMVCSQGPVKFSLLGNSLLEFEHQSTLKFSCFFAMPQWYPVTADVSCRIRVAIPSNNIDSLSTSFAVVPSYVSQIKSVEPLVKSKLTSGDIIGNSPKTMCYAVFVYDKFDNLVTDTSRIVEILALQTSDGQNVSYTLNGTLRASPKSNGIVEWCKLQATRLTSLAYLSIRVIPVSLFDTNRSFIFHSFSVSSPGMASQMSTKIHSNVSANQTILARDFKMPIISVLIEDSFKNSLRYDPGLIMRVSITKKSMSRALLSEQNNPHFDHVHAASIMQAAVSDGCLDYVDFALFPTHRPRGDEANLSYVFLNDLRVCEMGVYIFEMEIGRDFGSSGSMIFSSAVLSVDSFLYEVVQGFPTKVHLAPASYDAPTEAKTYSFVNDKLVIQIFDDGFNLVPGTAELTLKTNEGVFKVMPTSIQVSGDFSRVSYLWLSGLADLSRQNFQQSLKISSSSLKIIPSTVNIFVNATCSPGSYLSQMHNLPSSLKCAPCAPGSISFGWDFAMCHQCSPGTFAAQDASSCIVCPTGYATNLYGSSICRKCSPLYFSNLNGTKCVSLIFAGKPDFNVVPFVSNTIPSIQFYDELSQTFLNSVEVQVRLICLKRFNCTDSKSDADGLQLYSKYIRIPSGQPASQPEKFSVESSCGSNFLGSNFRWSMRLDASNVYPAIEIYDDTKIVINKCSPTIETIDPPAPKPKAIFGITLSETLTIIGVDFGIEPSMLLLMPGFPDLSPQMCIFTCRQTATQTFITSSSLLSQNPNLIDTFQCLTNFSFGMKMGDLITVDAVLYDGRRSWSNVKVQTICPVLYYLSDSNSAHGCEKCPYPESLTLAANKPSIEDCICNQGFYGTFGSDCKPCPKDHPGFDCQNFGSRWPQIKEGFYIEYSRLPTCVSKDECEAITACLYPWACPGDAEMSCLGSIGADTCYEGRGCYKCCSRYYMDDKNMCMQCAPRELSYALLICAILAPFILAAIAQAALTPARKVAIQGILDIVVFFQSISNVSVVQIPWPNFVDQAFGFIKFFSFGLSSVKEECSIYLEPVTKLFAMAALPFALAFVMAAISIHKVYHSLKEIRSQIDMLPRKHTLVSIQRHNNIPDLIRCLAMDVFSLHPGSNPNSLFAALSVTIKRRSENMIKVSALSSIKSKKYVMNLKKTNIFGHRGMLIKPYDYKQASDFLRNSGVQDAFLKNSTQIRQRISMILGIFLLTLQGTLSALLGTFRCTPLNEKLVLISNPEIICDGSIDTTYQSMYIVSVLGCLWCGFLTPIIISVVLRSKWCRLFALRNNECYIEMFDSIVADVSSTNYLYIPGTMIQTSLTLCVVIFVNVPAQQLLAQILFNFAELTCLLIIRPYLVKKSNDIEQVNSMTNFVVILSGLLFIAQVNGQQALYGSSRDILGMFVVAILMITTFIFVTSVAIDVASNLLLETKSHVSFWWKAFVVFLDEAILKQISGFFFGLQMAQFSSLTSKNVKETHQQQEQALTEKLISVEDKLNEKYLGSNIESSYFRSPLILKILRDLAIKKAHRLQADENNDFSGSIADFKNIEKLPEIMSVGSIHQILFNKHPDRVNDKDPPHDFKSFALNSVKTLDCMLPRSVQPMLLAHLVLAEEGVGRLDVDSIDFSKSAAATWTKMQQTIVRTSKTLVALSHFDQAQFKKWPVIFRPLQKFLFEWNMGVGTVQQYMANADIRPDKHLFNSLNSVFRAKQSIVRKKTSMLDFRTHENECQEDLHVTDIASVEKPKWGTLRGRLLTNALAFTKVPVTEFSVPNNPTPRAVLLKNTIATSQKTSEPKPSRKGGFKIRNSDGRLTNVPATNEWIIEYSLLKRQWQLKHLDDRGKDSYVAFLDTNLVLSGCRNILEWYVWNGDPHHRKYNIQTSVSVEIVTPGKPDAKNVRIAGFFARLLATTEGESIFWQFAPNLNGDYANLGLTSNNRFVYFNSFAAETYLASEKVREAEAQASRFGHAFVSSKASVVVGRRVLSNKRFINPAATSHSNSSTSAAKSLSAVGRQVGRPEELKRDRANDRSGVENHSDVIDEEKVDGDDWSESSDADQ